MPLRFIKKLASKLLGSNDKTKKPAHKAEPSRKGAPAPDARQHGRPRQQSRPYGQEQDKPQRGRPQPARGERGDGGRDGRRPRREESRRPADGGRPPQQQASGPAAAVASGTVRPVARPPSRPQRPARGAGEERPMSDPRSRRPGGAAGEEEVAKRRAAHEGWTLDQYQVPAAEGKKRFHDFSLPTELMHAVADLGFQYCTPIQELSLEHALAGKNVAGKAQTGTGKTAAFLVAILTRYLRSPEARQERGGAPRALVIAPTRELVIQICKDADALGRYCGLRSLAVYGLSLIHI